MMAGKAIPSLTRLYDAVANNSWNASMACRSDVLSGPAQLIVPATMRTITQWRIACGITTRENSLLRQQLERPQRAAARHMRQIRIGLTRIDATDPARHRDILLAVAFPGHWLADDPRRRLELP